MMRKRLGEMLLERGAVKKPQLDLALARQKTTSRRIGSLLCEMGLAREPDVLEALAEQLGTPSVDLAFAQVKTADLAAVPETFAQQHLVFPFQLVSDRLLVALADPADKKTLSALARMAGRPVDPHVALEFDLRRAIEGAYGALRNQQTEWLGPRAQSSSEFELDLDAIPAETGRWTGEFAAAPPLVPVPETLAEPAAPEVAAAPSLEAFDEDSMGILIEEIVEEETGPARSKVVSLPAILLVDAFDEDRQAQVAILKARPLQLLETRDVTVATSLVHGQAIALLIVEPELPGMHGFDWIQKLHDDARTKAIPLILTSRRWRGWRAHQDLVRFLGIGRFLDKPVSADRLLRAVDQALGTLKEDRDAVQAATKAHKRALEEQKAGRHAAAVESMREAVRLNPLAAALHRDLAAVLLKAGATYEAMQELEESADLDPTSLPVLRSLALLYERRGFASKAVEAWQRALQAANSPMEQSEIRKKIVELL